MRILWVLLTAPLLGAATYEIRPVPQGHFALEVFKTGLMSGRKHVFHFEKYQGTVEFDPAAPERSHVELTVAAASAVCRDTWVSAKDLQKIQALALAGMMDAEHHPQLVFSSTHVAPRGPNEYQVEGTLEVRGVTRPAVVMVTVLSRTDRELSFTGSAEVRLRDYGLKPPGAALGTIGTRNEMKVEFALTAFAR